MKKKNQRQLEMEYYKQKEHCNCGNPIPPMCRIYKGCFGMGYRYYVKHEWICDECGEKHVRIG